MEKNDRALRKSGDMIHENLWWMEWTDSVERLQLVYGGWISLTGSLILEVKKYASVTSTIIF